MLDHYISKVILVKYTNYEFKIWHISSALLLPIELNRFDITLFNYIATMLIELFLTMKHWNHKNF